MSQRFRNQKGITYSVGGVPDIMPQEDDSNVVEGYEMYDPAASDYPQPSGMAKPIGTDDILISQSYQFPGSRETFHAMQYDNKHFPTAGQGNVRDNVDWEVGGVSGLVDNIPYSLGVVSSNLVENFDLTGEMAVIRRQRNPSDRGAVATADFNALQSLAYAQAAASYWPNEASQALTVQAI